MAKQIIVQSPRPAIIEIGKKLGQSLIGAEIGVDKGLNAIFILETLKPTLLYLIDPWNNFLDIQSGEIIGEAQYQETIKKLEHYSNKEIIRDISENACKRFKDEELDFVYIDGDHCFDAVWGDINRWFLKIKKGGILAGHDYHEGIWGVVSAVNIFCEKNKLPLYLQGQDWWIKK